MGAPRASPVEHHPVLGRVLHGSVVRVGRWVSRCVVAIGVYRARFYELAREYLDLWSDLVNLCLGHQVNDNLQHI